jgi:putative flippase GtrA
MRRPRAFVASLMTWATLRFAISGATVAAFYLGAPLLVNATLGVPLEAALPVVYVLAVMLQFTLQRLFVFRHVSEFALTMRRQMLWYVMIAAIQYPLSAAATALLPGWLGLPERVVYVAATLVIALATFLFLRRNVFHAGEPATEATSGPAPNEADGAELHARVHGSPQLKV